MALCKSCSKFAAYDTSSEPEADLHFEEGTISGTVRIVLTSECCGDELRETTFDIDHEIETDAVIAALEAKAKEQEITLPEGYKDWTFEPPSDDVTVPPLDGEYSVDFSGEVTDRRETHDRKGKPIKNPRYQKTYYGFSGTATLSVTAAWNVDGGEAKVLTVNVDVTLEDECQASGMNEI